MTQKQIDLHLQTEFIDLLLGMIEEDRRKLAVLGNPESLEFQQTFQEPIDQWKAQCPEEAAEWAKRYGGDFIDTPLVKAPIPSALSANH